MSSRSSGYRVTTGAPAPAVTLKKPPTLTWPVIRVVADSRIVERIPFSSPSSSTSSVVTPMIAPPRSRVRRRCCTRLRKAIRKSWPMISLVALHRPHRGDAGGQEGRVERGEQSHQHHDDQRHHDVPRAEGGEEPRPGEEEVERL